MGILNTIDFSICEWDTASFLLFSGNVFDPLIYYSHIFPAVSALLIGIFIYLKNRKSKEGFLLFLFTLMFAMWCMSNLILWATERPEYTMFFWSILIYFEYFFYLFGLVFIYTFTRGSMPGKKFNIAIVTTFVPLFLFSHTKLNLEAYDFRDCWRGAIEGSLWKYYLYPLELLAVVTISIFIIIEFRKHRDKVKLLTGIGVIFALITLSLSNILESFTLDWNVGQYGLFGMPILVGLLAFLIVQYRIFNVKLLGAQALVLTLWILVGSLLFVAKSDTTKIVAGATLIFTTFAGYLLVRSVKKEVEQRELLEVLTNKLEAANERLKELDKAKSEFVSIASHQLRSPLTAIRGYASMLAEGSFGQMPQKALEAAKRIEESTKLMAMSIEDYLNVSRIESGNMKYNLSDFNLLEMTSKICDDMRPEALKQNLILLLRSDITSKGIVNADVGKAHQIIHNLINNSIKYTQKGSISVFVREDQKAKRIYIDISDTGIGMSQKTIDSLFQKFSRADNANSVNTSGTGLGLYVAVKMAEAMGGSISAHSEGDAKGSTFTFELPLAI